MHIIINKMCFICPVSTKAIQGAKSIGSFLYSAVNKAGKTVSEAGAKIKKSVGENVSFKKIHIFTAQLI